MLFQYTLACFRTRQCIWRLIVLKSMLHKTTAFRVAIYVTLLNSVRGKAHSTSRFASPDLSVYLVYRLSEGIRERVFLQSVICFPHGGVLQGKAV